MTEDVFAGQMFPVNPKVLEWIPSLFSLNERIVLTGSWRHGFYSLSAVAAFNVGAMFLSFDEVRDLEFRHDQMF
jgi:phosphatidylserine decarboxylase